MQRPPVNEVICSVAVERTEALIGPYLHDVLGHWFSDLPEVRQVPPYDMPPEPESVKQGLGVQFRPFELLAGSDAPRYWLTTPGQPWLVQVQGDYLALNWRAGHTPDPYVRFETVRERFADLLSVVGQGVARRNGNLVPVRAEMTYVNIIEPNAVWRRVNDLSDLLAFRLPDSEAVESVGINYAKELRGDDLWAGRVHVSLGSGYDVIADEARLHLNITARSGPLHARSVDGAFGFLDLAHESINSTFLGLLTSKAREVWGLDGSDD